MESGVLSAGGSGGDTAVAIKDDIVYERIDEETIDLSLPHLAKIVTAVSSRFSFTVKRYQAGAIADILEKRHNVFVIAGTGSGKSLIYQMLPFLVGNPIILVICPTLSLMGDQVMRLKRLGIKAVALTAEGIAENRDVWKEVQEGRYELVLASPEILLRDGSYFWDTILRNKKSVFCTRLLAIVIDECHLVWGWRQFRKDYLGLGSLRAHFPWITLVAMSATVTPNVLKFVVRTIGLRAGFRLYKQSIDRTNITQFVAQISKEGGYRQLQTLLVGTGATWSIPKTMIFVDSIDEAIVIAHVLQGSVPDHQCEYATQLVRPFHASLEPFLREEFLESFREGDCRILVCTDAAGMGVDIPDVQVVIQWGISEHLTIAMLWQRIGRAGRDPTLDALAITFAHERHMLPLLIPENSTWHGFNHPVDPLNQGYTKSFVGRIYGSPNSDQSYRFMAPTAYHKVDPPILWYLNTSGCRARTVMACFVDSAAYSTVVRGDNCCDNCIFDAVPQSQLPDFTRHRYDIRISTRYLHSAEHSESQVNETILLAQQKAARDSIKPDRAQRTAIRCALDSWAMEEFGDLHREIFTPRNREKVGDACTRIIDRRSLESELNNSRFYLQESVLNAHTDSLIRIITNTLRDLSTQSQISAHLGHSALNDLELTIPMGQTDARKRKRDPLKAAKKKVDAKASQQEKARVKRAMKETKSGTGKENQPPKQKAEPPI